MGGFAFLDKDDVAESKEFIKSLKLKNHKRALGNIIF